jgi:hypothetical protein
MPHEVAGNISRGDTRQYVGTWLGFPLFDGQDLGVEVYRDSGRDTFHADLFAPMFYKTRYVNAYALIAYDDNWVVKDTDAMVVPPGHRYDLSRSIDEANAGGFRLIVESSGYDDSEPHEILYAPLAHSRETLRQAPPLGKCIVFFTFTGMGFETIRVDGENIVDDFSSIMMGTVYTELTNDEELEGSQYRSGFFWKLFPPGKHEVEVRQRYIEQVASHTFQCESAQTKYIHIIDTPLDENYDIEFDVSDELPDTFIGRREIVFASGSRLGDSK